MFVVDLECAGGHRFEGWYDTSHDYEERTRAGDVVCPLCGDDDITRRLSTGGVLRARREAPATTTRPPAPDAPARVPLEIQQALARVVQWVKKTHEDVGDDFAARARAIHEGHEPARPIHGRATVDEERALAELEVPFVKIPIPDIEQN